MARRAGRFPPPARRAGRFAVRDEDGTAAPPVGARAFAGAEGRGPLPDVCVCACGACECASARLRACVRACSRMGVPVRVPCEKESRKRVHAHV